MTCKGPPEYGGLLHESRHLNPVRYCRPGPPVTCQIEKRPQSASQHPRGKHQEGHQQRTPYIHADLVREGSSRFHTGRAYVQPMLLQRSECQAAIVGNHTNAVIGQCSHRQTEEKITQKSQNHLEKRLFTQQVALLANPLSPSNIDLWSIGGAACTMRDERYSTRHWRGGRVVEGARLERV